ncbi:MAG: hypothetical protein ACI4R9_02070 [Kiritimatiellia bacterium]
MKRLTMRMSKLMNNVFWNSCHTPLMVPTVLLFAFCTMRSAVAANASLAKSGYWDEAETWTSGAVPSETDTITGGGTVTVRDTRTIAEVAIQNYTFGLIVDGSGGGGLTVTGNYRGNFGNYSPGIIDVINGGVLSLSTLELVNYGSGNNNNRIVVTNGASFKASGLVKTTSGTMPMTVLNNSTVRFDGDFQLTHESIRPGCTPKHELWWDGTGSFSVGGTLYVMGPNALQSSRAAGSVARIHLSGHPYMPIGGDFYLLETNRVDESETRQHTSELHFSAIAPGKGDKPMLSVGGTAYLDGAVSIGKGDWIGVIATDANQSPIKIMTAGGYDSTYSMFDRLELHANFTDGMASLAKSGNDILLVPALDTGAYTETLIAGESTQTYGSGDAAAKFLFRVKKQDPTVDDIEFYFQFSDSAWSGCDFMSKTSATKNLSVEKLEENPDGWTHKVTLHGMKNTCEFAVALDFSSFKFGSQPQNLGYMKRAMFGKKGTVQGFCIVVR